MKFTLVLSRLAVLLPLVYFGCGTTGGVPGPSPTGTIAGGPSPAAPPAPPAELPAALVVPESIAIDVDTTRSSSGSPALAALVGSGGKFSDQISFSSNLVYFADQRLNGLLAPLHAIKIPVSPSLTKMDAFLEVGTKVYSVHLNFADFDLNGDGVKEGCSGSTTPFPPGASALLPVCMRVWLDDGTQQYRLLAARFDTIPTADNPGAGSLRGEDLSFSGPASPVHVAANYNHIDPQNKFTDAFFGDLDETDPKNPTLPFSIRAFASQVGPDATAEKTSNANNDDGTDRGEGLGRWLEGGPPDHDFWSGSFNDSTDPSKNFSDQCAQISSGDGVDPSFCQGLGIDVDIDHLMFVDFTAPSDLEFFDFPLGPP